MSEIIFKELESTGMDYRRIIYITYKKCPVLGLKRCASLSRRLLISYCDAIITGDETRRDRILKVLYDAHIKSSQL